MKKIILLLLICFSCSVEEQSKEEPIIPQNGYSSLIKTETVNDCVFIYTGLDTNENGVLESVEYQTEDKVCSTQGVNSLVNISLVDDCNLFETGLDLNGDLVLQTSEVLQSQLLCPLSPVDGLNSLVDIQSVSDITICSNGGYYVFSGLDSNNNGTLEESERTSSTVLCNGEDGENGNSVDFILEDNCYALVTYLDSNDNGVYDEGEQIFNTSDPVCQEDSEDGSNSLISIIKEDNCITVSSGLDINNNNILDSNEITASETICNEDGDSGEDGNNSLIRLTDLEEGSELCEHGGVIISVGIDDNSDTILQDSEVDSETVICNLKCVHEVCEEIVVNTDHCNNNANYVVWLKDKSGSGYYFSNVDLVFERNDDYTATLKGKVNNGRLGDWYLEVTFSDFTTVTPEGSPKENRCGEADYDSFTYYLSTEGTMKQLSGTDEIEFVRKGEAFQLGYGANETEEDVTKKSASGWLKVTNECEYTVGDINITFEEICE